MNEKPEEEAQKDRTVPATERKPGGPFKTPFDPAHGLEDGRDAWDWRSRYPEEARRLINREAVLAGSYFGAFLLVTGIAAGFGGHSVTIDVFGASFVISSKLILALAAGGLGGTTFSIKWLMHSAATGKWHRDRIYWRIFVPMTGGVYAVVVLHLMAAGLMGAGAAAPPPDLGATAALAFLIGYFSDGVSGLLSNVANAVFGTVEKK